MREKDCGLKTVQCSLDIHMDSSFILITEIGTKLWNVLIFTILTYVYTCDICYVLISYEWLHTFSLLYSKLMSHE